MHKWIKIDLSSVIVPADINLNIYIQLVNASVVFFKFTCTWSWRV